MKAVKNPYSSTYSNATEVKEILGKNYIFESTLVSACGTILECFEFHPINFDDLILHVPTSTVYYKLDTIIEFLKCVYKMCNYNISECNCQLNTTHCVYSEIEKSLTMLYELNKPVDSPVPFDETVPF